MNPFINVYPHPHPYLTWGYPSCMCPAPANIYQAPVNTSNWMEQLGKQYPKFNSLPLNQVAMPGSHDTGMNPGILPIPGPDSFNVKSYAEYKAIPPIMSLVAPWAITQDYPVDNQLNAGSRYFDLRVSPLVSNSLTKGYKVCTDLYTLHGIYGQPLESILMEFQQFLKTNPKEILILDFQHLYEMTPTLYEKLNTLLTQYLGQWLIPTSVPLTSTVGSLQSNNQRVLVMIGEDHQRYTTPINNNLSYFTTGKFWSRSDTLTSNWFNTTSTETLQNDSNQEVTKMQGYDKLWVLQEVLTADAQAIIKAALKSVTPSVNGQYSLKGLESTMPTLLPQWVQQWTKQGSILNIVMYDFVTSQVSQSIIANNIPRIT